MAPTTNCPSSPADPVQASGADLLATTVDYSAVSFNRDVVLSAETLKKMPEALSTERFLEMDYAFAQGAFAAGGAYARVALENTTGRTLSVYDVRPVNIVVECVPLAALVQYGNEGGDPAEMVFNMDAAAPMPWAEDENGKIIGPYFETFPTIDLAAREKKTFLFTFQAETGAYTFDILVSYEVGGSKAQTLLRNGVVPFRVATDLCPDKNTRMAMASAEVEHMRSLRYENVRVREYLGIAVESPDTIATQCPAW